MKNEIFQQREIQVGSSEERLTIYSLDGVRWFSDQTRDVRRKLSP
jgi:hypothetical protein